ASPTRSSLTPRGAHLSQDATPERAWHRELRRGHGQQLDDRSQRGDLVAANDAAREVAPEVLELARVEAAEDVRARVAPAVAPLTARIARAHVATRLGSPSDSRSFVRPRRMRPLTVPTGVPSICAIWEWVNPPK